VMKLFALRAIQWLLALATAPGVALLSKRAQQSRDPEARDAGPIADAAKADLAALLESLNTSIAGLPSEEASERLDKYGFNEVQHEKAPRWYAQLLHSFNNPFIILLIALAVLPLL